MYTTGNLHEWSRILMEGERTYPRPWNKMRFYIKIGRPAAELRQVRIDRNPHNLGYDGWTCFYKCDDFSTIYAILNDSRWEERGWNINHLESYKMIVESGNQMPIYGERIELWSTSSYIHQEPWGHNRPNIFVKFRDQYWLAEEFEAKQEWTGGAEYPKTSPPNLRFRGDPFLPWNPVQQQARDERRNAMPIFNIPQRGDEWVLPADNNVVIENQIQWQILPAWDDRLLQVKSRKSTNVIDKALRDWGVFINTEADEPIRTP